MTKKSFNLRNGVAIAICLAGFLSANNTLAQQTVTYTDASGVTATYQTVGTDMASATMVDITNVPANVTKWVMPEYITFNNGLTVPLDRMATFFAAGLSMNSTLTEIVFPRQMFYVGGTDIFTALAGRNGRCKFNNLHKITFGEAMKTLNNYYFAGQPLDSVIFLGSEVIAGEEYGTPTFQCGIGTFQGCPSTTKIIVPCGTLDIFIQSFPSNGNPANYWQGTEAAEITWTTANFEEAECPNTLTVLSTDNNLGLTMANCGWLWSNGENQGNASGKVTLYALPKGGNAFISWNDGNLENPRMVNVTEDVTYTAQFAVHSGAGIAEAQNAPTFQIYPNPAKEQLTVSLPELTVGTLTVFDLNGKIVKNQAINGASAVINTSAFAAGTYVIRVIKDGRASEGVKFVKE